MKIYGKVFLSTFILAALSFSIFGTLMIQTVFHSALDREIEIGKNQNQMIKLTYETTLNSVPDLYEHAGVQVLNELAQSLNSWMDTEKTTMQIMDSYGPTIYSDTDRKPDALLLEQISLEESGYQIYQEGGRHYLDVASVIDFRLRQKQLYMVTTTDISHIFEERRQMFHTYRTTILFMLAGVAVVTFIISYFLTRSVRQLSGIARNYAKGNMSARAKVSGHDEVSVLAQDFNVMADRLSDRMLSIEDQAKRQENFTSAFAHELKTPLTSIIGYADMIRSMNLTEEERVKAAGYIYSQGKRLEALSFKLLELMVLKKQDFEFVNMDAHYFIETVFDLAEVGTLEKNMELKMSAEKGKVYGEKDLLISLFANLIDNARKASTEGQRIWIEGKTAGSGYEISVRDEGRGIPKEDLSKITDAFYMVDKSRSRKEGGAGLGMTLCSRIVQIHGASWDIESEPGKGTTVRVILKGENEIPADRPDGKDKAKAEEHTDSPDGKDKGKAKKHTDTPNGKDKGKAKDHTDRKDGVME